MFDYLRPQPKTSNSVIAKLRSNIVQYGIITLVFGSVFLLLYASVFLSQQAKGEFRFNKHFSFLDKSSELPFHSILQMPNEDWSRAQELTFKSYTGRLWLKVEIPMLEEHSVLLHFNDPLIDNVIVNVVDHNGELPKITAEFRVGDLQAFNDRELALPYFVIPVELLKGKTTLYMSASSQTSLNLSFGIWSESGFIEFYDNLTTFLGIVLGYILALLSYNLMMYATARKKAYLWYGLYLSGFFLHSMTLSGFGFQYLWPQAVGLQTVMSGVTISVTFMCLIKFTQIVIASNKKSFNFLFNTQVYSHLILSILSIYTLNPFFLKLHFIAILLSSLLMPVVCYFTRKDGSKTSGFFTLVWLVFIMTLVSSFFGRIGIISLSLDPLYCLFFGFHLQTLLIGAALVHEYRETFSKTLILKETVLREKEKTVKAKDEMLKLQQDARNKLEHQVKAQTLQLEGALSDLSSASLELKTIRNVDGLTGLPNRLAFDEAVQKLSRISIDMGGSLCVVVFDIDHFKKVNDTYGHIAGDDCLRKFSALLKETFMLEHYACCRFGGEEFILATNLPIVKVEQQVNVFRLAVENMVVETGSCNISFTTSAGIASKRLINEADSRRLFAMADEKLYIAKQKGRNLVIA